MPKRTICIQKAGRVSMRHKSLVIESDIGVAEIPLADIGTVIFEAHSTRVSAAALSAMCDSGVSALLCDEAHLPNGMILPFAQHFRHTHVA